jgi:hypothetical protein
MRLALVLGILFVAAPAALADSNNKGKIEGTKWSSEETTVKGNKLPAGILKLEFKADGGLVYTVAGTALTGKYALGDGDKVTLNMDKDLGGRKSHEQTVAIKDGKLTLTDSDGTTVTFTKGK